MDDDVNELHASNLEYLTKPLQGMNSEMKCTI